MGTDFHLFKEGIEPKWEDETCAKGGKWTYYVPKQKDGEELDESWLNLLLCMIGEQFSETTEVCGAVISVRQKQHRIALWTKTASSEPEQVAIGRHLKDILDIPESEKIGYMVHDDAIRLGTPFDIVQFTRKQAIQNPNVERQSLTYLATLYVWQVDVLLFFTKAEIT